MTTSADVEPHTLKAWLHDGQEIALLDVREAGQFGESHLFYAIPLPYSRLEMGIRRLVPRFNTRVVVYDSGSEGVAVKAVQRMQALGYSQVYVLRGGTAAWAAAGRVLFQGVNLPSKTFGELVELHLGTPHITAQELAQRQARGDNLVVLDGRPLSEFAKMNIPGGICCPNGELALRIGQMAPDPNTTVVINCAGRTRSIIGAQTLINMGIPNPVLALKNGTQGWYLVDLPLEHGNRRRHPLTPPEEDLSARRAQASALAQRHGATMVTAPEVQSWLQATDRSCFVLDVRTPEEFAQGSLAGAQSAPGGQLLQATDQYVGVRGARLVLVDDDGVRAPVVASWLRQMGWQAHVLQDGVRAHLDAIPVARQPAPISHATPLSVAEAARRQQAGQLTVLDLRASFAYRTAHLPGSVWSIRPQVVAQLQSMKQAADLAVLLVADEPDVAHLAALDLTEAGYGPVHLLEGGLQAWSAAGHAVHSSPANPPDAQCIDYLFFVHDRHDGNKEAARRYLDWETGLLAQLDADELAGFHVMAP